jgi:GNAT superfamily N-acetyltransferase
MEIAIRKIMPADIDRVITQFIAQGDNKPREFWEKYLREHENGERIVIVAEVDGVIAGYVTLFPKAKDAVPYLEAGFPEVKDFHVFEKFQRRGIGAKLMDEIESIAAGFADTVCLGVGLHSGYGSAQRMYVKRGYVFDGSGVWNGNVPAEKYGMVENGDDLLLYMSKKLRCLAK